MGKPYTKWSQEEIEYVRLHAKEMQYSEIAKVIGRTEESVATRVAILGLDLHKNRCQSEQKTRQRRPRWTQEETDQLIELAQDHTILEISRIMHRNRKTVNKRFHEMGLQPFNKESTWTDEELLYLRQLAPNHTIYQIQTRMNKKLSAIQKKLDELDIPHIQPGKRIWTDEKLALLKEAAPTHTKNELVEILGIPRSTISLKIKELGLSFRKLQ